MSRQTTVREEALYWLFATFAFAWFSDLGFHGEYIIMALAALALTIFSVFTFIKLVLLSIRRY